MAARPFLALATLALAACSSADEVAEDVGVKEKPAAEATAKATARSAKAVKVREETKLFLYEYSYPAQAAAIPALAAVLDARGAKARDEMIGEVGELEAEEGDPGEFPVPQHSFEEEWQVVADLPGWLSLSGFFSTYSGGAHGMYGMEGYVWDKQRGRGMDSADLFRSQDYLGSLMEGRVCEALNKEREDRRGEPVVEGEDNMFNGCPELSDGTILVGSSNGKTFDRITVWFGPYVAGPWVEGHYELDFPMTREMLEAVKPAYRAAFSAKR
jgi:hypothetical protein